MSMLSAQCDKLRERAATLRQGRWSDGADDARMMEDAADTIWELRDGLQRANAENAKLRELVRDLYEMAYPEYPSAFEAAFADRMRELGVMCE